MILDAFKALAPELPAYQARFRPVYFEPIIGSGERFTVAVLAQDAQGIGRVVQTVSARKLACMYGGHAAQVINLVSLALESAGKFFDAGGDIDHWRPPFAGIHLGATESARSNAEMNGIMFQALTSYASLYSGDIIERALEEIEGRTPEPEDAEQLNTSLLQQIRSLTLDIKPQFAGHWQREVIVQNNVTVSIDYLGVTYNANLANFDVKQIKPAFKSAKAKLFDLDVLRQKRHAEIMQCEQQFELLIALKSTASDEAEEHFYKLEQLADSIALRVVKKASAEELAMRIIQQEAA
jgi:hypothetical protein